MFFACKIGLSNKEHKSDKRNKITFYLLKDTKLSSSLHLSVAIMILLQKSLSFCFQDKQNSLIKNYFQNKEAKIKRYLPVSKNSYVIQILPIVKLFIALILSMGEIVSSKGNVGRVNLGVGTPYYGTPKTP